MQKVSLFENIFLLFIAADLESLREEKHKS